MCAISPAAAVKSYSEKKRGADGIESTEMHTQYCRSHHICAAVRGTGTHQVFGSFYFKKQSIKATLLKESTVIFSFKDECHIFFYIFLLCTQVFLQDEERRERREEGRKEAERSQRREQEGQRERKGGRSGILSISGPVMSITEIKIQGSNRHYMKDMTHFQ